MSDLTDAIVALEARVLPPGVRAVPFGPGVALVGPDGHPVPLVTGGVAALDSGVPFDPDDMHGVGIGKDGIQVARPGDDTPAAEIVYTAAPDGTIVWAFRPGPDFDALAVRVAELEARLAEIADAAGGDD